MLVLHHVSSFNKAAATQTNSEDKANKQKTGQKTSRQPAKHLFRFRCTIFGALNPMTRPKVREYKVTSHDRFHDALLRFLVIDRFVLVPLYRGSYMLNV